MTPRTLVSLTAAGLVLTLFLHGCKASQGVASAIPLCEQKDRVVVAGIEYGVKFTQGLPPVDVLRHAQYRDTIQSKCLCRLLYNRDAAASWELRSTSAEIDARLVFIAHCHEMTSDTIAFGGWYMKLDGALYVIDLELLDAVSRFLSDDMRHSIEWWMKNVAMPSPNQ